MMRTPTRVVAARMVAEKRAVERLAPEASMMEAMVKPSGALWRRMARKMSQPRAEERAKPEPMATPSKRAWTARPARTE